MFLWQARAASSESSGVEEHSNDEGSGSRGCSFTPLSAHMLTFSLTHTVGPQGPPSCEVMDSKRPHVCRISQMAAGHQRLSRCYSSTGRRLRRMVDGFGAWLACLAPDGWCGRVTKWLDIAYVCSQKKSSQPG
eukprot:572582-Prymnesium_polylepis.1